MEGSAARRYAKQRGTAPQLQQYRQEAARLTRDLPAGAAILEVAPGPGYFAVELARDGRFTVTGLDISHTFVTLAGELAARSGVKVDFRQGDGTAMPFDAEQFDLVVTQAAFKNFDRPLTAINEMHRVLKPGGRAVIQDMSAEAGRAAIANEVASMRLGSVAALTTRLILTWLRRRAYTPTQFDDLARRSAFGRATVASGGIGLEAVFTRS
jgi:ubiquinone/menaquinone biosynthesis C-methylase UbiE